MFKLPNGKKIDEKHIVSAMEDNDLSHLYFLDIKTGKVEAISKILNSRKKVLKKLDDDRYFKIPKIPKRQIRNWMKQYTDEFIKREDPAFASKIYPILIGKNIFQRFRKTLEKSEEGWIHGWDQWRADLTYEALQNWLLSLPINITEEFEFFDNCPVCQAMEKAHGENKEISLDELKEAFGKIKNRKYN